jgi:acetoin utilization deacetylase AcuC-like enzyme
VEDQPGGFRFARTGLQCYTVSHSASTSVLEGAMVTAYAYDELFLKHTFPGHPESADRLEAVMGHLQASDLLPLLSAVEARPASRDQIGRFHTRQYIERVEWLSEHGGGHLDPDTYTNADTYAAALLAAGALIDVTRSVLAGKAQNGFALVRPPGHHATQGQGMGFCIFNNVVIAALDAFQGQRVERILIYDFDVHHGNGTQDAFEEDPRVLYISTHQYPHYPGTGAAGETGIGAGAGTVVNIPLSPGIGDSGYSRVMKEITQPIAHRYQPDLVLVSAGFDAHWSDPLAMMLLSLRGCATIARDLVALADQLCDGRIIFTLEGGYDRRVLAHGVENAFHALLHDDTTSDPIGPAPYEERPVEHRIAEIKRIHHLA